MAYSDFTFERAVETFGLTVDTTADLYRHVPPVAVSPETAVCLNRFESLALAINTEKSRSELLISPVLVDAWLRSNFTLSYYSGTEFVVDPADGLSGTADFLFTRGPQVPTPTAPVLVVVEGKKESIAAGYGQCAAEMVAAQRLNRRAGHDGTVYGCITIGNNWKFFELTGPRLAIDQKEYLIAAADRILGIVLFMVGHHPTLSATAAAA